MAGEERGQGTRLEATACCREAEEKGTCENVSAIRRFLLRNAAKRKILVKEYLSPDPVPIWFAMVEDGENRSTALSYESKDAALFMAFISFENPAYTFLSD